MLHDDSFVTGLLIGDKRGYDRGYEEGGGGAAGSRDTIEFGDGMGVDIWTVPTYFDSEAVNDGRCESDWEKKSFMASLRADYCCAILVEKYGWAAAWGNWVNPDLPPDYTGDISHNNIYISLYDDDGLVARCSHPVATKGCNTWERDMWLLVSPTLICCISKSNDHSIPCLVWGFVYGQGKDTGEWKPWTGPNLTYPSTLFGYDGTAGDLSNPASSVSDYVSTKQVEVNVTGEGKPGQVDNVWCIRNIQAITLDSGNVKVEPNFKSVGTVTKHNPDGRRLMYFAHNTTLPDGSYPGIYNMYFVLLPRGVNQPTWRGLMDKDSMDPTRGNGATTQWDETYIAAEGIPGSYYSGYNKGYEDGLAAGGGGGENPGEGYDEGYQKGYQDGYAAGVAASGDNDGYTLHPAPDGATELYIAIDAVALRTLQLCFCQTVTRGVSINWGDGTTETIAGTGPVYPEHTYAANGEYTIRLLPSDDCTLTLGGGTSVAKSLFGNSSSIGTNTGCVLKKAVIGKNIPTVGRMAFVSAFCLEEVYISDGVETLGANCFQSCYGLHRVRLPNTLTTLNAGAEFNNCHALDTIDIPASVTTIGVNAIANCYSLKRISFPGAVSISNAALTGCYGLQRVDLPETLQTLAYNFAGTTYNLREIHIAATTPPTLNGTLATGFSNFVVYIPQGTLAAYSAANRWSTIAAKLIEE